jgi:hypothetical protein
MIQKMKWLVGLSMIAQSLTACSNSSFLKSMSLSVSEQNSQDFINLTTEVSMGNISLTELTLPIYDPNTQVQLGEIDLNSAADGAITLSLNASAVTSGTSALGATLPNGRALPGAMASTTLVGIPVLNYSRVYIGGDLKSSIVVGMALTISAFDSLSAIGNANIFFGEAFNTSLSGIAGLYTGTAANESGIAVFATYTAPVVAPTPASAVALDAHILAASSVSASPSISVSGQTPKNKANTQYNEGMSQGGEEKAYNFMYGSKRKVSPQ